MAHQQWEVLRQRDADVIGGFRQLAERLGYEAHSTLGFQLANEHHHHIQTNFETAESDSTLAIVLKANTAAIWRSRIQFSNVGISLRVDRPPEKSTDLVVLEFANNVDATVLANVLLRVHAIFPVYARSDTIDRLLGDELAAFYRAREAGLLRLEALAQSIVDNTEAYRQQLDTKFDERVAQHSSQLAEDRAEQKRRVDTEREELERHRQAVDQRAKTLDDRESRHARRALREVLQETIRERGQRFTLTADTTRKRTVIHTLFAALLAIGSGFVSVTLIEHWGMKTDLIYAIRLGVGAAAVVATFYVYIRWADNWFRQHADEEFRLKRLSLDVDRASWVVETAMEWQQQNQGPIPAQLLGELSRDLFAPAKGSASVRHPIEEATAVALGTASSLKVKLPGGSEASFDRQGVKRLNEAIENS